MIVLCIALAACGGMGVAVLNRSLTTLVSRKKMPLNRFWLLYAAHLVAIVSWLTVVWLLSVWLMLSPVLPMAGAVTGQAIVAIGLAVRDKRRKKPEGRGDLP